MQSLLQEMVVGNVFVFLLVFMRFGIALMIMPGIGDSFVSPQIRLLFALALSFVLTPVMAANLPPVPAETGDFIALLLVEAFVGFFIGTIMRILISSLDTAGMTISIQSGYSNAMVFNPVTATQGSLVGALYSTLGVTLMLTLDMHHTMLASVVESYRMFPANGSLPDVGAAFEVIRQVVTVAFSIGIQMALPFLVVGLLTQIGFGLLGRLMPQVQIFFLALPVQITLGLILIAMVLSVGMLYWTSNYNNLLIRFLEL